MHEAQRQMNWPMALWVLWSIACAYSVRWVVVRQLPKTLAGWRYPIAYSAFLALAAVGIVVFLISGLDYKRPPPTNLPAMLVYFLVIWSPLGMPIVLGAGPVIVWDALLAVVRTGKVSTSGPSPNDR